MKNTRTKKRPRLIRIILFILLVISFTVILLSLPFWRIKNVVVENNKIVRADLLKQKANISLDGNIFFTNYSEITRRIKGIPQIKKAAVFGSLPSTIVIKVEERRPFAVAIVGGSYMVVDDEGVIIDQMNEGQGISSIEAEVQDLPSVVGLPKEAIEGGKKIDPDVMIAIVESFKLLGSIFEKSKFEVEMKRSDDISILINDILKVKMGSHENIDKKLFVLSRILAKIDTGKVEYIDVRVPDDPAVKFK